ncbi:MAG: acyl-CoA dehydrogenase family protein [Geminicoccaceae bacterium]|nr:acyl-CoA dehydrogenase family protein [Geminicoccaceae bacterium]MCX8099663.1 acyl-CoA dehydrogenase family protein [Geminicoccaceae bacterium]MDW8370900.1 acyl-CoA dehydrogenase family protein [Geminicoccaceae bacterium]
MDLTLDPALEDLRARVAAFVDERLLPLEEDPASWGEGEQIREDLLETLRAEVKARGLWCPQMPEERGGLGVGPVGMAVLYEEMGRCRFGPVCFNCAAPDDGNMWVLEKVGTPEQKARWLDPIVRGEVRSAIVMTEPHPGSGSDPAGMMLTRAEKRNDRYRVFGRKWFITGAEGAKHFILLARTSEDPRRGLTAMLFHAEQPGWRILRRIPIMGPEEHGGHCELELDGLEVPFENVLLGEGLGMKVTQIRLGMARLTHCMRWLGMARRALEIALPWIRERRAFGQVLAEKESVQGLLGEAAMEIAVGRLLVMRAAFKIGRGEKAQAEVSMAKIQVADALHRAIDTAIQLLGAKGYSKDTPLEWMYRYARQARLVDGASEVHRMLVARHLLAQGRGFFAWP